MKKHLFFLLVLCSTSSFAQYDTLVNISRQVCDSLHSPEQATRQASQAETGKVMKTMIMRNQTEWMQAYQNSKERSGENLISFGAYFAYIIKTHCPKYRAIQKPKDTYLKNKKNLRPLYTQAQAFIWDLTDSLATDSLTVHLSDSLNQTSTYLLLDSIKSELGKQKRNAVPSILLAYHKGYTFRVRYYSYTSNTLEYQIDVVFKNTADLRIDSVERKTKTQLLKQPEQANIRYEVEASFVTPSPD